MKKNSTSRPVAANSGQGLYVAIGASLFNQPVVDRLLHSCQQELLDLGVARHCLEIARAPGALELPLVMARFADTRRFDALIALGCVIRGDTYHFEIVCHQSAQGLMAVQLQSRQPVINGILTTYTAAQARARSEIKGREAAWAALLMVQRA